MFFKIQNVCTILIVSLLVNTSIIAQDNHGYKEVIIIEKTIDENGNVISKSVKRKQGNYTEEELNDLIEDEVKMLHSFDMEGMGFGDFQGFFGNEGTPTGKATLGIFVANENGQAIITEVIPNSGAAEADIRTGDKLISIEKIPVATVEDITEVVGDKKAGEEVMVVVWRDGSEIEKIVKLGGNTQSGFGSFFDSPNNSMLGFFGEDGGMSMDIDSMMKRLRGMEMFDFDMNSMEGLFDRSTTPSKRKNIEEDDRPQLGIFVEDKNEAVLVVGVAPDSPAERAGLKVGDSIERIDDNRVSSFRELKSWMNTKTLGDEALLTISRKGKISQKKLILK